MLGSGVRATLREPNTSQPWFEPCSRSQFALLVKWYNCCFVISHWQFDSVMGHHSLLGYRLARSKALVFEISIMGSNPIAPANSATIAHLDRVQRYERWGSEFESLWSYQNIQFFVNRVKYTYYREPLPC